jgi:hypothetical protein
MVTLLEALAFPGAKFLVNLKVLIINKWSSTGGFIYVIPRTRCCVELE